MSGNLSARLKRIREASATGRPVGSVPRASGVGTASLTSPGESFAASFWTEAAPYVLHRSSSTPIVGLPATLDPGLAVLCPSAQAAFPNGAPLDAARLLLFDLETTGLSGGAGTVAFLAAFGRFDRAEGDRSARLTIDQYLLLDYPGEPAFLEFVTAEFVRNDGEPVLGSYNGRSFDMQILKTRCIMNGMIPPDPAHLDLVHAARRLWRRRLPSCSLAEVERGVLGLDRGEDLPGSEAPDAWFDFLKTGASTRLLAIGDHNRRDLEGLAALLLRMEGVARDPEAAAASGQVDPEGLALRWLGEAKSARRRGGPSIHLEETALILMEYAVETGSARAAMALAGELVRRGKAERAAELRRRVTETTASEVPASLTAAACAFLATDALRRLRDKDAAMAWLEKALALEGLSEGMRTRLKGRRARLSVKGPKKEL